MEDVTRMEVPTARLKLRPELVGRWSPVGVGGDVEGERGGGGFESTTSRILIHTYCI